MLHWQVGKRQMFQWTELQFGLLVTTTLAPHRDPVRGCSTRRQLNQIRMKLSEDVTGGSRRPSNRQRHLLTSWDDDHTLFSSQQLPTDSLPPCGLFPDQYSQPQDGFTQPAHDLPRPHGANRLVRTDSSPLETSSFKEGILRASSDISVEKLRLP